MSARSRLIHLMPCIACTIENCSQPNRTEEHHLNLDGKAGQPRRGDEYSIPLCSWHHRGETVHKLNQGQMRVCCGPSLAVESKEFRRIYGSDDVLLGLTNESAVIRGVA